MRWTPWATTTSPRTCGPGCFENWTIHVSAFHGLTGCSRPSQWSFASLFRRHFRGCFTIYNRKNHMKQYLYIRAYMAGITLPTVMLVFLIIAFTIARYALNLTDPIERMILFPMAIV